MRAPRTLTALALGLFGSTDSAAQSPVDLGGEGALRNSTALPNQQTAAAALARGDGAWAETLVAAAGDRPGARTRAFDAWRAALELSRPGDGVRLRAIAGAGPRLFPDPDGTHERRAEDVSIAVQRRLAAISGADRDAWTRRFLAPGAAALAREFARDEPSTFGLGEVERTFPATPAACSAALALTDLDLERARPSAAAVWLDRARAHLELSRSAWDGAQPEAVERALARRAAVIQSSLAGLFIGDHTAPQPDFPTAPAEGDEAPSGDLRLISKHYIRGLARTADEPYGRGLGSGVAFFDDGAALVQGPYSVLLADPSGPQGGPEEARMFPYMLFGTGMTQVRAAASAGGWNAYPATDGQRTVLVFGRGQRPRPMGDLPVAPTGNALGVVVRGRSERALEPLWLLRDGILVERPKPRRPGVDLHVPSESGGTEVPGWNLGRGWEFQPGPVFVDDAIFVLARGLGDSTNQTDDHADEVRLIALDATSGAVRWSREVTSERGLIDPGNRGRAGFFATTTMPLNVDRRSGHLLVGTNVGMLCAYDVADGRLAWAIQNQRRRVDEGGWPGSRPPILVDARRRDGDSRSSAPRAAWFTPFDSEYAYALPAGPAPLSGGLLLEPPRARRGALDLAAVKAGAKPGENASLVLLGRDGRHAAVLLEGPNGGRRTATYLAPGERFAGRPAIGSNGLLVAGTRELGVLSLGADLRLIDAAPIPTLGTGRGGDVVVFGGRIHVIGRDTIWIWDRP